MESEFDAEDYSIGWICALPLEFEAATAILDQQHAQLPAVDENDPNAYKFGQVGSYNIVIACLPSGVYGTTSAAIVVTNLRRSFPSVQHCLMVGIGGGAPLLPHNDIRLGDVIVGHPTGGYGGVLSYLFGKTIQEGRFVQTNMHLNSPPELFLNAISKLRSEKSEMQSIVDSFLEKNESDRKFTRPNEDRLYRAEYDHPIDNTSCDQCDPDMIVTRSPRPRNQNQSCVHYGLIASGDQVMKHGMTRERLSQEKGVLCFEMEAAGIVNTLPFLVIRGVCDYSDSHKNKIWQPYAALTAAAFAKDLLLRLPSLGTETRGSRSTKIPISLPVALGAVYGTFESDGEPKCLKDTRLSLLRAIYEWADSSGLQTNLPIFWLSGGAGTGKSTIARTVAGALHQKGLLGGTFFFRRGAGDCSNASKFITSLCRGLMMHIPGMRVGIREALKEDPNIADKPLKEQFEELVQKPLAKLTPIRRTILVIDALDECENQKHIENIVSLLSQATEIDRSICIFITSRGEAFINDIFKAVPQVVEKRVLHDVEALEIQHDIQVFFEQRLSELRAQRDLPPTWPTRDDIQLLVKIACPLFIVAANICRLLEDREFRPEKQLAELLDPANRDAIMEANPEKSLRVTYQNILDQRLVNKTKFQKRSIIREFQNVIGTIVLLEAPLSLKSLAGLVDMNEVDVQCRLEGFQSVLHIPSDPSGTIRTLHLSFREFLLDNETKEVSTFWLDESEIHRAIFQRCLKLLRRHLKKDICDLRWPEVHYSNIPTGTIQATFTSDLEYACRHWVTHLVKAKGSLQDDDETHDFLGSHCLEWLEATSLLKIYAQNTYAIIRLKSMLLENGATNLGKYLYDLGKFIQHNAEIITKMPLQTYYSALLWAPEDSIIRQKFYPRHLSWVKYASGMPKTWNTRLYVFEADTMIPPTVIRFSPDSRYIATTSKFVKIARIRDGILDDLKMVKIRDCILGDIKMVIHPSENDRYAESIAFTPDGKSLILDMRSTIEIWDIDLDTKTGESTLRWIKNRSARGYGSIAISPDGTYIALHGTNSVEIWSTTNGSIIRSFELRRGDHRHFTISLNWRVFMAQSTMNELYVWDFNSEVPLQTIDNFDSFSLRPLHLSPSGQTLACFLKCWNENEQDMLKFWILRFGKYEKLDWKSPLRSRECMAFINEETFLVPSERDLDETRNCCVELWDISSQSILMRLETGHVKTMAVSSDQRLLSTGGQIWEIPSEDLMKAGSIDTRAECLWLERVPGSDYLVTCSFEDGYRLIFWDLSSGEPIIQAQSQSYKHIKAPMTGPSLSSGGSKRTFSADGRLLATIDSRQSQLILWDLVRREEIFHYESEDHDQHRTGLVISRFYFSPDCEFLVVIYEGKMFRSRFRDSVSLVASQVLIFSTRCRQAEPIRKFERWHGKTGMARGGLIDIPSDKSYERIFFSSDGKFLSIQRDVTLEVWRIRDWAKMLSTSVKPTNKTKYPEPVIRLAEDGTVAYSYSPSEFTECQQYQQEEQDNGMYLDNSWLVNVVSGENIWVPDEYRTLFGCCILGDYIAWVTAKTKKMVVLRVKL